MEVTHIIQISDTHLFDDPLGDYGGVDTTRSLSRVLAHIKSHEARIDAMIISGDLVQEVVPEAYQTLLSLLEGFGAPVYCFPGNHDAPDLMTQCLNRDTVHYLPEIRLGHWQAIFLDSRQAGQHAGRLRLPELKRLESALQAAGELPVLIGLHHHPVPVHSPWMDGMALEEAGELFAITDQYPQVKAIIWGHIHQAFDSSRQGVRLLGCPSTCAQFAPGATEYQQDTLGPGYRRLCLSADGSLETEIIRVGES